MKSYLNSYEEKKYLVMDDTFDEKAAKAKYDALPEEDKKIMEEMLKEMRATLKKKD